MSGTANNIEVSLIEIELPSPRSAILMSTYVLDPSNPLVRQAMLEEGVVPSELLLHSLQDFAGPRISPEIQQLRFDFHRRRVHEAAKVVKLRLKQTKSRPNLRLSPVASPAKPIFKSVSPKPKASKALSPAPTLPQLNLLNPTLSQVTQKLEQVEELKRQIRQNQAQLSDQKTTHERFVREMERSQAQLHKDLIRNLAQGEKQPRTEPTAGVAEVCRAKSRKSTRNRPVLRELEDNVEAKLQAIEAKIEANRVQKAEMMKAKAEHAARSTLKATQYAAQLHSLRSSLEEARIKEYASKQKGLENRLKTAKNVQKEPNSKAPSPKTQRSSLPDTSRPAQLATERLTTPKIPDLSVRMEELRLKDEVKWTKVRRARRQFVGFK